MSTKKALKAIHSKLAAHENEAALYEATQLLATLGDVTKDPENGAALYAFRGLALSNLERYEEAETSYLQALRLQPGHQGATRGATKLYNLNKQWDKLGRLLETSVQVACDRGDCDLTAKSLQDVIDFRLKHGSEEQLYQALSLLAPSSPLVQIVQSSPIPAGAYIPMAIPTFPAASTSSPPKLPMPLPPVQVLAGSLSLALFLLLHVQYDSDKLIESLVSNRRKRLDAGTERDVRSAVEVEVFSGQLGISMLNLLHDVAAHPSADDAVRRESEVLEFHYWRRLAGALRTDPINNTSKSVTKVPKNESVPKRLELPVPTLFQQPSLPILNKQAALSRASDLAEGFILLDIGGKTEDAWIWAMEGRDEPSIEYNLDFLHKFARAFPSSPMTEFINDYCLWFKYSLPEPDERIAGTSAEKENGEDTQSNAPAASKKKSDFLNARDRRKARRRAEQDGNFAEDIEEEEREERLASMTRLLKRLPKSIFAHRVMAHVAIEEQDWVNAISNAEKGRKLLNYLEKERGVFLQSVHTSLDATLGIGLVFYFSPKHHSRATRLLTGVLDITPSHFEARFALAQILEASGDWTGARAHFQYLLDQGASEANELSAREELGWCLANEGRLLEGREVLEDVVEKRNATAEQNVTVDESSPRARAWWRLGRIEWMIGDTASRTQAEEWFMASLRAKESYAPAYTALGICYAEAYDPPDMARSLKCFQKAFELDATETEAARRLAQGYADDEEWALVRAIASRVMEGEGGIEGIAGGEVMNANGRFAPTNGWAWKALGSTEMHYKNYAKAILAYQVALRSDERDSSTWVMLGNAYLKSGRHMAGIKALNFALTLDPTNWLANFHIGEIYVELGSYDAAVKTFQAVSAMISGDEIGIIAALAEATLSLGRHAAKFGFRERSRSAFHSAIEYARQVLHTGRSHRPWAWKMIGDATFELSEYESGPSDVASSAVILRPVLQLLIEDDVDCRSNISGLESLSNLLHNTPTYLHTLRTAVFAFAYRSHLLRNEIRVADSAFYDLACALYALCLRLPDSTESQAATLSAISAICRALERDPADEKLWNALGVICAKDGPQFAQHSFVVSLECFPKDPIVWTNLGYLYLQLDDRELANECFLKSQIIDPDYGRAWLGQGLLAKRDGQHEHAESLFSQAVTLSVGSLLEADLALALGTFERFCASPLDDATSLHHPAFVLRRYTVARPNDAAAKHLYALICERLGLMDEAVQSLETTVRLLEEEFEHSESSVVETAYLLAQVNLGRLQLATGQYTAALDTFTNCWELSTGRNDTYAPQIRVQVRLGQALSHFWMKDIDSSLETFQLALEESSGHINSNAKDELVVTVARTLWAIGGQDAREAAKGHLMECLESESTSVVVTAVLGAIAVASNDIDLIDATLAELSNASPLLRRAQDPDGLAGFVLYVQALAQGDQTTALAALESTIAVNPIAITPRNLLTLALIATGRQDVASSLLAGARSPNLIDMAESERVQGLSMALQDSQMNNTLQHAIMLAPWEQRGWEALSWAKQVNIHTES